MEALSLPARGENKHWKGELCLPSLPTSTRGFHPTGVPSPLSPISAMSPPRQHSQVMSEGTHCQRALVAALLHGSAHEDVIAHRGVADPGVLKQRRKGDGEARQSKEEGYSVRSGKAWAKPCAGIALLWSVAAACTIIDLSSPAHKMGPTCAVYAMVPVTCTEPETQRISPSRAESREDLPLPTCPPHSRQHSRSNTSTRWE